MTVISDLSLLHKAERKMREDAHACGDPGDSMIPAVADLLRVAATDMWAYGGLCECGSTCFDCDDALWQPYVRRALVVARAYLNDAGEAPSPQEGRWDSIQGSIDRIPPEADFAGDHLVRLWAKTVDGKMIQNTRVIPDFEAKMLPSVNIFRFVLDQMVDEMDEENIV